MEKVILTMEQQEKYEIIKKVNDGLISKNRASIKLNISRRQVDQLLKSTKKKAKCHLFTETITKHPRIKRNSAL